MSGNYELRRIAELKEKYIRDEAAALEFALEKGQKEGFETGYNSGIVKGIEDGMKQGIEQGIEQGINHGKYQEKVQVVKNMLAKNRDITLISEITELKIEEILQINQGH